jgi:hypothetical protein
MPESMASNCLTFGRFRPKNKFKIGLDRETGKPYIPGHREQPEGNDDMSKAKVFAHRYVVLVEKTYIVKESTWSAKSYPTFADASYAARRAESRVNVSAAVIDTAKKVITENWIVLNKTA